ncbi:MAG: helix-turn-helix domain-containing protein [Corynebacteriales bacterium]|nr:helix-turn-helix domain-containing protein [Mycobacteriales bacterium]
MDPAALKATLPRLERAAGALASQSVARMDETLPWYRELPADRRSWITLVVQAGVRALADWLRDPTTAPAGMGEHIFADAPREMVSAITLQQTVALIRVTVQVVEEQVPHLAAEGEEHALREAILLYSREVAFGAAEVYARAAERRGAWDLRLQALLVDALLSENSAEIAARAAALGWEGQPPLVVAIGTAPASQDLSEVMEAGHRIGLDVLAGMHSDQLIVVVAGAADPVATVAALAGSFGPGPIVVGDQVDTVPEAARSAKTAEAGYQAATAWPGAPRPVRASELLPERALAGDESARHALRVLVGTLEKASGLRDTLIAYTESGGSLEATARLLFVHPNTVRYRLGRISELTGIAVTTPRGSFTLRLALAISHITDKKL